MWISCLQRDWRQHDESQAAEIEYIITVQMCELLCVQVVIVWLWLIMSWCVWELWPCRAPTVCILLILLPKYTAACDIRSLWCHQPPPPPPLLFPPGAVTFDPGGHCVMWRLQLVSFSSLMNHSAAFCWTVKSAVGGLFSVTMATHRFTMGFPQWEWTWSHTGNVIVPTSPWTLTSDLPAANWRWC